MGGAWRLSARFADVRMGRWRCRRVGEIRKGREMETKSIGPVESGLLSGLREGVKRQTASLGGVSDGGRRVLGDLLSVQGRQSVQVQGGVLKYLDPRVDELRAKVQLRRDEEFVGEVQVDAPAERGKVAVTFSDDRINLGGPSSSDGQQEEFTFRIVGRDGEQVINFASGTHVADIVQGINLFTDQTGVEAELSGTTVTLQSVEFGSTEFVSIDLLDDGNIVPPPQVTIDDRSAGSWVEGEPLEDFGVDVRGRINGIEAQGVGRRLSVSTSEFGLSVGLETSVFEEWSGQFSFEAFRILGKGAPGGIQDFSSGGRVDRTA